MIECLVYTYSLTSILTILILYILNAYEQYICIMDEHENFQLEEKRIALAKISKCVTNYVNKKNSWAIVN